MRRAALLLAVFASFGVPVAHAQEVTPPPPPPVVADGVTIAGLAVGGLTAEEVAAAVRAYFARPFMFSFGNRSPQPTPRRLGARANVTIAVTSALSAAPFQALPLPYRVGSTRLRRYTNMLGRRFSRPPVDSRARLVGLRPRITRARVGVRVRPLVLRRRVRRALAADTRGPISVPFVSLRPAVRRSNFGAVIVIRRGSHRLYLYNGRYFWRTFGVAVGQSVYPTPLGRFHIAVKQRHPWWYPPNSSWADGADPIPPGPGNPLGTRWMGLSRGGVGIHGTPDAASIGYSASHGCIRMRISEAEWLFRRVRVGTPVFIVSA